MTRDNILFTVCGFIIGLVIGAIALGPVLYRKGITSRSLVAGAAAPGTQQAPPTGDGANGAVMQNVMQQVATLKAELQKNPGNVDAAVQLANMYMDARKFPQAITYYEQALAHADSPDVATDLGICYRATGQLDKALATFNAIQAKHPDHWQSQFNKALVLVDLQRVDEARPIVEKLKKEHGDVPEIQHFDEAIRGMKK